MLLSRVAESVYWAGRYLERAECTARIVREHSNLIVDLPTWVRVTWIPLLAIEGSREAFDAAHERVDEHTIVSWVVGAKENPGSILTAVERARENLRSTREVLPRDLWMVVNDLYLYVAANHTDGVARRSRSRFLDRVIADAQRVSGIADATMRRDDAEEFLRIGRLVERADMTTRVIDVRAGSIMHDSDGDTFDDVQWMGVLRSLSALQMFQRSTRSGVSGPATLRFLVLDRAFPRSVAFCLAEIERVAAALPRDELVGPACRDAARLLEGERIGDLSGEELHDLADRLQIAIGRVHGAITAAYFHRSPDES